MPELPEVETTLRGIAPHISGQTITQIIVRNRRLRWPIIKQIDELLTGKTLTRLTRRGKYLILECTTASLLLHLGMSGRLRVLSGDNEPQKHDHVDIHFCNGKLLRFTDPRRFGALLYTEAPPSEHPLLATLGIEPLSDDFNTDYLFKKAASHKIAIKNFIMNSKVVVGVGNIYATEALFRARIHPEQAANALTRKQLQQLVSAIKFILKQAIEKGGTTLKDFTQSDGSPGYFSMELKAYGKAGKPCPRCHKTLCGIRLGQRSTVYCTHCQRI